MPGISGLNETGSCERPTTTTPVGFDGGGAPGRTGVCACTPNADVAARAPAPRPNRSRRLRLQFEISRGSLFARIVLSFSGAAACIGLPHTELQNNELSSSKLSSPAGKMFNISEGPSSGPAPTFLRSRQSVREVAGPAGIKGQHSTEFHKFSLEWLRTRSAHHRDSQYSRLSAETPCPIQRCPQQALTMMPTKIWRQ